jgi:hypothetical protein
MVTFGPTFLLLGILCLITPATQIWLKYKSLDQYFIELWLSSLSLQQLAGFRFLTLSGILFLFLGFAGIFLGF